MLDDVAEVLPNTTAGDLLYGQNDWRCRVTTFFYQTARTVSGAFSNGCGVWWVVQGIDPGGKWVVHSVMLFPKISNAPSFQWKNARTASAADFSKTLVTNSGFGG